jgi:hypothetical protein
LLELGAVLTHAVAQPMALIEADTGREWKVRADAHKHPQSRSLMEKALSPMAIIIRASLKHLEDATAPGLARLSTDRRIRRAPAVLERLHDRDCSCVVGIEVGVC